MASDEDDDDDIWFGSDFRLNESHELEYIGDQYPKDGIPEEAAVVDASADAHIVPESQQENPSVPAEALLKPKAKRNTISFAQKKVLAKSDLFLDPLYHDKFSDPTAELVGQVRECPRESNGKRYRIEWKNEGRPLPPGLDRTWLWCYIPTSKDTRERLQSAIIAYDTSMDDQHKKPAAKPSAKPRAKSASNISKSLSTPVEFVHTIATAAMATTASVRTSSTISSLSQNTIASPEAPRAHSTRQRGTRSTDTVESLSDDGDDLDEEDNIYQECSVDEGSDSDSDDEDDRTESSHTGGIAQLLQDIQWNFSCDLDVVDRDAPSPYSGPSGLKPRVAASFQTPFECLGVCGGLDYDLVCRLARNSNEYARKYLLVNDRNNRLHGQRFENITTEEMYHFLGITLRISLSPIDGGGYGAYFSAHNRRICGVELKGTDGFARHYMSLNRFKQIRAAFHPEDRCSGEGGDKCYQLRHLLNTMNQAASNTKFIGENVTFDEGGIGSRHRLNPVRQYNKDKPQKFRVDFFIMACSRSYFIHHVDVYQGRNATNVGIHRAVRTLPTTQKAVMNAVLSTGMHNEVHGARHIALDNRYQCPELAFLLREKFKIYSTGTCRANRKGRLKELMTLDMRKQERGSYKFAVDKHNKILCCQWVDSKVVNVVSSILSFEVSEVHRQVGSKKKAYTCPLVVRKYQRNMLGVDKSDQMRAAGGGFAAKAHYQKWYKRAYFCIMDMMSLNALIAWNLSAKNALGRQVRPELKRYEFLWVIAQCMLDYKDPTTGTVADVVTVTTGDHSSLQFADGHYPLPCSDPNTRCAVCRLDYNTERKARGHKRSQGASTIDNKQLQKNMANRLATCARCKIAAHATRAPQLRLIHQMEPFKNLTCFQIAHTPEGYQVWKRGENTGNGKAYYPQMTHPICKKLRELHGLDPQQARKKRKRSDNTTDNTVDDNSSS
jgi:Transposase IS4